MGTKAPDPGVSLPGLAAQHADLRGSVLGLAAQVADLRGIVVRVQARVDTAGSTSNLKLAEQLTAVADRVAVLSADDGPPPAVTAPVWHELTPDQHAAQLAELAIWVDGFLTASYPHISLRPCWDAHPAAIWELSTLRAEWLRVYDRKNPDLAGALAWHDRYLPGVSLRLGKMILKDCRGKCALVRSPVRALPQPQPRRPRAG